MTRFRLLWLASIVLLAGSLRAAEPARPNLLFILTDDQRFDAMGNMNPMLHTPAMDRLAREGVRFENAFVTTSICAAGRASVFSGTVERTHMYTFGRRPLATRFTENSYPTLLRASGYRTGFVGKFGVRVEGGQQNAMFDVFRPLGQNPYFKKLPDDSQRHLTDITGDVAIEFLRTCKAEQPFCLSVSFNAPHATDGDPRQYIWPAAVDELYRDATIPPAPLSDDAFFASQPKFLRESLNRVRWHWRFDSPEKYQRMVKGYYRMISGVDAVVGRLRAELDRLGLADDTVVVLMADNGYFLNERGFAGKWLPHEVSLRVPLLVFDPRADRQSAGARPTATALNVDIAPTLLDLAGLPIPEQMQGRSLAPILAGSPPNNWRDDFFFEHLMEHPQIVKHEGVRTGRFKYARYFEQQPVYETLYDLQADPLETRNLVAATQHAELLGQLRRRCNQLRDEYGGPYVRPVNKKKRP